MAEAHAPCIYGLIDPADGRTYYVGRTADLAQRFNAHYSSGVHPYISADNLVARWVGSLRRDDRRPRMVVLEVNPPDGLVAAERRWITHCLARGEPLLNRRTPVLGREPPAIGLPFPEDERRCFPLRRWCEAQGLAGFDLCRACVEVATRLGWEEPYLGLFADVIGRLESAYYEFTRQTPSEEMLERITLVRDFTGLSLRELLQPSRFLAP